MASSSDATVQEKTEDETLSYDELSIWSDPVFKPMLTVAVVTIVLYAIIPLNPSLMGPGNNNIPLYTYSVTALVFVVVVLGFLYDYWVEKNVESLDSGGDRK